MRGKLLLSALFLPLAAMAQNAASAEFQAKQLTAQSNANVSAQTTALLQPQDCDATDLPYTENFESVAVPALPECTTAINAGSGNVWGTAQTAGYGFGSKTLRYTWNTQNPANTWFFTKGLNLTAGQTVSISFKYGSAGSSLYTEKLKVHIGTSASVAGMNATPLVDHPLVNNNVTANTDNLTFIPETSGVYYLGFHCYSNTDQFYLFVDDISITGSLSSEKLSPKTAVAYPNPARDLVHVSVPDATIESVSVYNLLGQKVIEQKSGTTEFDLDISRLPRGNYILEVHSGTVSRIKIVKE